MPAYFQRPENALKRANEFINVGKQAQALEVLSDTMKSRKQRTWQKVHEPIMEKYLSLCVELKKSHLAKEGLYQYKNICQQVNIKSLEDVVRKYLELAEEKTEDARKESHQAVIDIDDLDIIATPENLLLSAVSGEDTQDRTDRAILTPWVKFLWESYRQCLDLLRNNTSVERLYQEIAQQAFKFCVKYTRKTEFRKLCDNLRNHLSHFHKLIAKQRESGAITPESLRSQAFHLETRLVQLDHAIQMELWQEAFKAIEDVHGLIILSKEPPKASLMAKFYQKLGLVFWKSGNHMFHAAAWHRYFHLSREQRKNLSMEELQKMASRVLCATLAIPIPASRSVIDQMLEQDQTTADKQRRLATLLGLTSPPTRANLLKDLVKYNIHSYSYPELQELYKWLEVEFHPLKLAGRVQTSLQFLEKKDDLGKYVPALEDIAITRLLKQVSQVYQTIEFTRFAKLVPFATEFRLERVVVDAARRLELQVRIDHQTQSLIFGTDLVVAQKEDYPEGPFIQSMPSEQIRSQLATMAQALEQAYKLVQPQEIQDRKDELKAHIVQAYRQTAKKEHHRILLRRQIIEERKEELENQSIAREKQEIQLYEDQRRKMYEAEMIRLEREAEERERQRRLEEHKEITRKAARERLEQLKTTAVGARVFADMDEEVMANLDADDIMAKQVEQLEKEKKELLEKLTRQEKKVDYLARAMRLEELPLLEKQCNEEQVESQEFWQEQERLRIEQLGQERTVALENRDRLKRIKADRDIFMEQLKTSRYSNYKEKLAEFEKQLAVERKKRMAENKARRKEERKMKWHTEREDEMQRRQDEELVRQREEEERMIEEKKNQEEAEYAERIRKLEEMEEKKRQREREIEEKQRRQDVDRKPAGDSRDGGDGKPAWAGASKSVGWRDRVKDKEESWKRPAAGPEEGGAWRRGAPERAPASEPTERPPPRDDWRDRPAAREERPPLRDERGPPREDRNADGGAWRRGAPPRDDAPPREDREGGAWRRPAPAAREEHAGWRDRAAPRDDAPSEGGWRSKAPPSERVPTGDRAPPREGGGGGWRDRERGGADREGGGWRDRAGPRDGERAPPREDGWRGGDRGGRDAGGGRDDWRRGGPPARGGRDDHPDDRRGAPPDQDRTPARRDATEDDGWTTVKK